MSAGTSDSSTTSMSRSTGSTCAECGSEAIAARFHERHRIAYGFEVQSESVFALGIRVRAVGRIPKPRFEPVGRTGAPEPVRVRQIWFPETGYVETPIYARAAWPPRAPLAGPAVIDEYDSTTVVLPGQRWLTDETGSIVIEEAR